MLREIFTVFDATVQKSYEIIIVDDASSDGSIAIVEQERQKYFAGRKSDYLTGISLQKLPGQCGQFKALLRGISAARGNLIITMDSDMQHDPADIPRLLAITGSHDMICGVRENRYDGMARIICSRIANAFRNLITGDTTSDSGCMFRIMRRECVAAILTCEDRLFGCEALFFPLLVRKKGFRVGETPVSHRRRVSGRSRYHLVRGRLLSGIAACFRVRSGRMAR